MKKIIITLTAILLLACEQPTFTEIDLPTTNPPITDPVTDAIYTMASYDGTTLELYDGEKWIYAYTGTVRAAGNGWLTVYDVAYNINAGVQYQLSCVPDHIIFTGTDFYYTRSGVVYKNREVINDFGLTAADDIKEFKTGIYILQDRYWKHVETGEAYFYTLGDNVATVNDAGDKITILGDGIYGYTGYTQTSYQWFKSGESYYSNNGVRYTINDGIYNGATQLREFNSGGLLFTTWANAPVPHCIGEYTKNSDAKQLWLNLTEGTMYEYSAELDTLTDAGKIFSGYGDYTTARNEHKDFYSVYINGLFYLPLSGSIYEYNPNNGSVSVFLSGDKVVFGL